MTRLVADEAFEQLPQMPPSRGRVGAPDRTPARAPRQARADHAQCVMLGGWFGLSDPQLTKCLRDRVSFRWFVGLSLTDATPDESTFVRFRARLREVNLDWRISEDTVAQLERRGLLIKEGTRLDATIVERAGTATDEQWTRMREVLYLLDRDTPVARQATPRSLPRHARAEATRAQERSERAHDLRDPLRRRSISGILGGPALRAVSTSSTSFRLSRLGEAAHQNPPDPAPI